VLHSCQQLGRIHSISCGANPQLHLREFYIISKLIHAGSFVFLQGKSDLFLIPYFGWMSALFGGISIDRNSQSSAIK
jgi:hypothetical protein